MKRFVSLLSVLLIIVCGVIAGVFTLYSLPVRKIEALNAVWEHLHIALSAFNGMFVSVLVFLVLVVLRKLPASVMNILPSHVDSHPSYGCDTEYKIRDNRLNLNWHIAVYLFAAIAILYIPLFFIWASGLLVVPKNESLEVWMKILLPIIGGIGGVFYLVLKYREQQNNELNLKFSEQEARRHQENFQKELRQKEKELESAAERFRYEREKGEERNIQEELRTAIRLLGEDSPQNRVFAVYALAEVADRYRGAIKQQVVNILCSYLRAECSEPTSSGKLKYGVVEDVIIRVIAEHLRKDRDDLEEKVQTLLDDQLWCDCSFNFKSAIFSERVDFSNTTWNGENGFVSVVFSDVCRFEKIIFNQKVSFNSAEFKSQLILDEAQFLNFADFRYCVFGGFVSLNKSRIVDANFSYSQFLGYRAFAKAKFGSVTGLPADFYETERD